MSATRRTPGNDAGDSLRAIDLALADVLRRQDRASGADGDEHVLLGAALASFAIGEGHAAFDPARPQALLDDGRDWPAAGAWREALAQSPWVATPATGEAADPAAPLVLERGLLYLRRYREYERRLAAGLQRLVRQATTTGDLAALAPLFAQLFPQARDGDLQARAAALALMQSLLLVTGGPGTGKTTTIARLLVLLTAQARHLDDAPPRIALAAPTGRAAERMAQSLRDAVAQLRAGGIDPALCDVLPHEARTLHRLLGPIGDSARFRHDRDHPLPFDVVVVDEASMVDLPLMCKLVEAVPDGAQLILLGDADQLPSVEAGDVLAAIVEAAGESDTLPPASRARLAPLLGEPATSRTRAMPAVHPAPGPQLQLALSLEAQAQAQAQADEDEAVQETAPTLHGHCVQLRRGYRQSAALDLAPLALAARGGDATRALALLRGESLRGVHFHDGLSDLLAGATRGPLLAPWRELATFTDPAPALRHATRQRVLTAMRAGAQGAIQLNARIEEALAGAHRDPYFHGRLLLVTENSYRHGLFNGDIGVCLRDAAGAIVAWFAGAGGVRGFHPAALPAHSGAFAMTVHKAQGSEYDTVWLQLPRQDARTLSRELVYTALTRARDAVHVCGSASVLAAALSRQTQRVSGLAWRLRS